MTEPHLENARASAEADRLIELISGLPVHAQYVLLALANLDENTSEKDWFRTSNIYDTYFKSVKNR